MSSWKDTTAYAYGDRDHGPRTWTIDIGGETVCVTRHMSHDPDVWLLRWGHLERVVSRGTAAEAQAVALDIVEAHALALDIVEAHALAMLRDVERARKAGEHG